MLFLKIMGENMKSKNKTKWNLMKELQKFRKPLPPPNQVHIPKTEYNRKDKSWMKREEI